MPAERPNKDTCVRVDNVVVAPEHLPLLTAERHTEPAAQAVLAAACAARLGMAPEAFGPITLVRRAIDARARKVRLHVAVDLNLPAPRARAAVARRRARSG